MGISTVTSARINKNQKAGNPYLNEPLFFERFATAGMVKTSSFSHHVTDSAAGAMALLTGRKVDSKTLGMVPKSGTVCAKGTDLHVTDGIVENALQKGLDVGFVTSARITHATPGALYAKGLHRDVEYDGAAKELGAAECNDIAKQLLSYPASEFKVMMGGGADFLMEKSRGGMREDGMNIDLEWNKLGGSRRVLGDRKDLQGVTASSEKLLGVFAGSHLPMYLEQQMAGSKTVPRLSEMAAKAIEQLQHDDKGFFLMVEGGNIDIAEHANQMHLAFAEVYEFEEAIRKAREMTDPSETLIIVTADHGHALTLPGYLPVEKSLFSSDVVTQPSAKEEHKFELPGLFFASGPGFRGGLRMADDHVHEEERADPLYRQPASVPMTHGAHGGEDVGIWADGPLAHLFSSSLENTEVAYIIKFLLCLSSSGHTICDASEQRETPQQNGFIRGVAESLGPEGLMLSSVFLLIVAILSLLTTVFVAGLLFVHNKRSLRDLECSSQATLVKTPM
ncbi:alkaline phosphatase family protein [Ancylostoma caninum]|uniref:alkaline phosphatase n=1 Tax=Ancylostoma caninum TaxID=29170 RepID=A0A368FLC1_ANCCA|nr:alkaline phosphatase family protein [Ancylostoma caninum]